MPPEDVGSAVNVMKQKTKRMIVGAMAGLAVSGAATIGVGILMNHLDAAHRLGGFRDYGPWTWRRGLQHLISDYTAPARYCLGPFNVDDRYMYLYKTIHVHTGPMSKVFAWCCWITPVLAGIGIGKMTVRKAGNTELHNSGVRGRLADSAP